MKLFGLKVGNHQHPKITYQTSHGYNSYSRDARASMNINEVMPPNTFIAEYTDQPKDKIEEDCDRDFFMTAEEALDYGIIDEVIKTKTSHIEKPPMPSL